MYTKNNFEYNIAVIAVVNEMNSWDSPVISFLIEIPDFYDIPNQTTLHMKIQSN